jgi:hypothetical protein
VVYSLSGLIQDDDTSTEKLILLDYINDYAEKNPDVTSQWRSQATHTPLGPQMTKSSYKIPSLLKPLTTIKELTSKLNNKLK